MSAVEDTILRWTPRIALVTSVIVLILCAVSIYILTYEAKTACSSDPSSRECLTRIAGLGCPAANESRTR